MRHLSRSVVNVLLMLIVLGLPHAASTIPILNSVGNSTASAATGNKALYYSLEGILGVALPLGVSFAVQKEVVVPGRKFIHDQVEEDAVAMVSVGIAGVLPQDYGAINQVAVGDSAQPVANTKSIGLMVCQRCFQNTHVRNIGGGMLDWFSASMASSMFNHWWYNMPFSWEDVSAATASATAFIPEYAVMYGFDKFLLYVGAVSNPWLFYPIIGLRSVVRAAVFEAAATGLQAWFTGQSTDQWLSNFGWGTLQYSVETAIWDGVTSHVSFRGALPRPLGWLREQVSPWVLGRVAENGGRVNYDRRPVVVGNSYYVIANAVVPNIPFLMQPVSEVSHSNASVVMPPPLPMVGKP